MKTVVLALLKLGISAGLIAFVVMRLDLDAALAAIGELSPLFLLFCLVVVVLQLWLAAWRWELLMRRALNEPLGMGTATSLTFVGMFFGQLTFTTVGADVVRAWGAHLHGVGVRNAVVGVAIDRILGLAAVGFLIVLGAPLLWIASGDGNAVGGVVLVAMIIVVGAVAFLVMDRVLAWLPQIRVIRGLAAIAVDARHLVGDRLLFGQITAMALAWHIATVLLAVVMARALGAPLGLLDGFAIIPAVFLVSNLPISIAGWGVREGAMAVAFTMLGLDPTAALALSVLMGLLNLAASLPGAVIWVTALRRKGTPAIAMNQAEDAVGAP